MLSRLVIAVLLLTVASVTADQRTVTSEGAKWQVILKDDGTWVYADNIPLGRNYGVTSHFRASMWGMSKDSVKKIVRFQIDYDGENILMCKSLFAGFQVNWTHFFAKDQLARTRYDVVVYYPDGAGYIQLYESTRDSLIAKYGSPIVDDTAYTRYRLRPNNPSEWGLALDEGHVQFQSEWNDQTTYVILCLGCRDFGRTFFIEYSSLAHRGLEESFVADPVDTMQDVYQRAHYLLDVKPYKDVRAFGEIQVTVNADPSLELDEQKLIDYATLRFKNNFADYRIDKELSHTSASELTDEQKRGSICLMKFHVWTVGTDYPVAHHIRMICSVLPLDGSWEGIDVSAHEASVLGYCSKATLESEVKTVMDSMMEEFAVKFFKAKGEF